MHGTSRAGKNSMSDTGANIHTNFQLTDIIKSATEVLSCKKKLRYISFDRYFWREKHFCQKI